MKISELDINFQPAVLPDGVEMEYDDVTRAPFQLYGLIRENGQFRRMPESRAKAVSEGVGQVSKFTAGGRVCFQTNSRYVAVLVKVFEKDCVGQETMLGAAGFDLYVDDTFRAAFIPDYRFEDGYCQIADLGDDMMKNITINFPIYGKISELYIGVTKSAVLEAYHPYIGIPPVVYYGSSITQGGCASRPGNSYENEIARRTGVDYLNLGFAGNAKGEEAMADYITELDMSIFVIDYDHNAPNAAFLRQTHEKFYQIVRRSHVDLPIVLISRPDFRGDDTAAANREVVHSTYLNAKRRGDENVYYIDGRSFFEGIPVSFCSVDRTHPNDLGFYCMAVRIGDVIKDILNRNGV